MAFQRKSKSFAPSRSLTELPAVIIATHILPRLPVADAVRTSVLCRSWRHLWQSIPDLSFSRSDDGLTIATFDAAVYLRSLTIASVPGHNFTVSSVIFSFKNLTHLNLHRCNLSHLEESPGFPKLEVLDLNLCDFVEDSCVVSDLISGCPLLKELRLVDVLGCRFLEINTPSLESLVVHCFFEHFTLLEVSPLLAAASIGLSSIEDDEVEDDDDDEEFDEGNCNLLRLLGNATSIEKLELVEYSLYFLGRFGVPQRMPNRFMRLRVVKMVVDFAVQKETAAALCLLRSCPNLEELEIEGHDYLRGYDYNLGEEFWSGEERLKLPRLRVLKLTAFTCSETDLEFMEFLLPCAVRLEQLAIDPNERGSIDSLKFAEGLRTFTKAEVICRVTKKQPTTEPSADTFTMNEVETDTDHHSEEQDSE